MNNQAFLAESPLYLIAYRVYTPKYVDFLDTEDIRRKFSCNKNRA